MKFFNLTLLLLFTELLFSGCTKGDRALLDFYLTQPRDPNLIGKWKSLNDPSMYQIYSEDGYIYNYSDGDINIAGVQGDCWYTEGDSILRRYFYTGSSVKGSKEQPARYYKIEDGYLYISEKNVFPVTPTYKREKKQ